MTVVHTISPPAGPRPADHRLSPTQRAKVRQALAAALGAGRPATRADILAELCPTPVLAAVTLADVPVAPARGSVAVAFVAPITLPVSPDAVVTFDDAAARLGLAVATVKRYAARSSGKLTRVGDGVSSASVASLAATR